MLLNLLLNSAVSLEGPPAPAWTGWDTCPASLAIKFLLNATRKFKSLVLAYLTLVGHLNKVLVDHLTRFLVSHLRLVIWKDLLGHLKSVMWKDLASFGILCSFIIWSVLYDFIRNLKFQYKFNIKKNPLDVNYLFLMFIFSNSFH